MKTKLYTIIVLFLILALVPTAFAQQPPRLESVSYQCLDFVHCGDGGSNDKNQRCEPIGDDSAHTSVHWGHRSQVDLTDLEKLPTDAEILVTECVDAGIDLNNDGKADPICTTGDSTQDKQLFCGDPNATNPQCDHYSLLRNHSDIQYSLEKHPTNGVYYLINGKFQRSIGVPIKVNADGRSTVTAIEWEGYSPKNLVRKYLGWWYSPSSANPTPLQITNTPIPTGGIGGQQQAILTFPTLVPQPTEPPPRVDDCKGKAWDPYGRVFDAKSLEPIPEAQVMLKQRNPQNIFSLDYAKEQNLLIVNPFPIDKNGEFIFLVVDGDYQLEPISSGYVHPAMAEQSTLLPATLSVYSDLYFRDSPPVLQRGAIQHRDIPLNPADGVGKEYKLEILSEDVELSVTGRMEYSGRLSHPYAEIVIETCSKEQGIEVCANPQVYGRNNGGANRYGNFIFTLDQTQLESGQYYRRSFRKINLTTLNSLGFLPVKQVLNSILSVLLPVVNAQAPTNTAAIQPIISYIEGYAYDTDGNLLPSATVLIKVPLSEVPVYQTVTNVNGYYKITSEFLPDTEYTIEYQRADNTKTKITTSQLLRQNKEFIASENIDPYLITTQSTDPRRNVTPSYVPPAKISPIQNEFPTTSEETSTPVESTEESVNNNIFLIGAILLLLIATAGTLIGVYLYRKKMQEPQI